MTESFGQFLNPDGPLEDDGVAVIQNNADAFTNCRAIHKLATDKIQRDEMTIVLVGFFPIVWCDCILSSRDMFVIASPTSLTCVHRCNCTQSPSWDPDLMPVSMVKRAMRLYKYDAMHTRFVEKGFGDPFVNTAFGAPAAMHVGDLAVFDECVDFTAKQFKRSVADLCQRAQELQNHFCE